MMSNSPSLNKNQTNKILSWGTKFFSTHPGQEKILYSSSNCGCTIDSLTECVAKKGVEPDPLSYVEYTAVGFDGRIWTPQEWSELVQLNEYIIALETTYSVMFPTSTIKGIEDKSFTEAFFNNVPMHENLSLPGELCPQIASFLSKSECVDVYKTMSDFHYATECSDKVANTGYYLIDSIEKLVEFDNMPANFLLKTPSIDSSSWFYFCKPLLHEEYIQIGMFILFAFFLAFLIVFASYFLVIQKPEAEKLSTYECGFEPYDDAKNRFDVQFYIIAILFVLFDIEIIVLLPWCLSLSKLTLLGYWSMIEFLLELGLGFVYVWCIGALDW